MLWSRLVNYVNRTAAALAACMALWSSACGDTGKPRTTNEVASTASPGVGLNAATPAATAGSTPASERRQATAPANGYGDQIAWRGLDEGLAEAARLGRPLMLVVHAAWCPRCRELKQRFFDPALAETSDRLIMVNLDQDQSPEALRHGPDGQYIPRVLFFDPQGRLDPELQNPRGGKYKYFYTPQDDLVAMMQQALDRHDQAAKL